MNVSVCDDVSSCVVVLKMAEGVDLDQVNAALKDLWDEILRDSYAREAALKKGLDEKALTSLDPPVMAGPDGSNFGTAATIAIFIGLESSKALIKLSTEALWKSGFWAEYVWPFLRAKFGAKLKPGS